NAPDGPAAARSPAGGAKSTRSRKTAVLLAVAAIWLVAGDLHRVAAVAQVCVGDCDGSGDGTVNEIIIMVNIALGNGMLSTCLHGDANGSGSIEITEIIQAVNNALNGCPVPAWLLQNPAPSGEDLFGVSFVDAQTGWAVGSGGTILHTTDDGAS